MKYTHKLDELTDANSATDTSSTIQAEIKRVEERLASLKDKSIALLFLLMTCIACCWVQTSEWEQPKF